MKSKPHGTHRTILGTALTGMIAIAALGAGPAAAAEVESARLSGPHVHENLTLYLVHGPDEADTRSILTLDEALATGKVVVHETGSVNQLAVENQSSDETVFIQAGDIVKGGRQDRALSNDLFLKPRSGTQSIEAFCVEAGRWRKRGQEDDRAFRSSKNMLSSKALKLAARDARAQVQVWEQVSELQEQLGQQSGLDVRSARSETSLQLSLEHEVVKAKTQEYVDDLEKLVSDYPDTLGYVVVLGGEINSAEIYASHDLFSRLWPKLALAIATEALADGPRIEAGARLDAEDVMAFLERAEQGAPQMDPAPGNRLRTTDDTIFVQAGPRELPELHRSYLTK